MAADRPSSNPQPVLVTTAGQLAELCETIRRERRFAFDTEFIRERSFTPKVWLVQVATSASFVLIDPVNLDLQPFWELVIDPGIETVVFAGGQDSEICFLRHGQAPRNLFDVQVAAGLLGHDYPCSYGRLVKEIVGVELRQGQTYSDWSRRPLTQAQLDYALEDILFLLPIRDRFGQELDRLGRGPWLREEMARMEDPSVYDPRAKAGYATIRGHKALTPRQLAVLAELSRWRRQAAWAHDVPIRHYASDECLCELAWRQPATAAAIQRLRGFPKTGAAAAAGEALEAIRRGQAVAAAQQEDEGPAGSAGSAGSQDEDNHGGNGDSILGDLAVAVAKSICLSEQICPRLFATRKDYDDLARALSRPGPNCDPQERFGAGSQGQGKEPESQPRLLQGWRGTLTRARLVPVLSGTKAVRVRHFPDQPTIEILEGDKSGW